MTRGLYSAIHYVYTIPLGLPGTNMSADKFNSTASGSVDSDTRNVIHCVSH